MAVLAQAAPADTNNAVLYTVTTRVKLQKLVICDTSAAGADARVFIDDNGTTATAATAIIYDKAIAADTYLEMDLDKVTLSTPTGTITVRSSVGDALTFTLFGEEDLT
jgi:hypothetical protein